MNNQLSFGQMVLAVFLGFLVFNIVGAILYAVIFVGVVAFAPKEVHLADKEKPADLKAKIYIDGARPVRPEFKTPEEARLILAGRKPMPK